MQVFCIASSSPTLQALKLPGAYYIGSESITMSLWGLEENENGSLIDGCPQLQVKKYKQYFRLPQAVLMCESVYF